MAEELEIGTVLFFDTKRRFGFIERGDGKPNIFCHANDVQTRALPLYPGQKVEFTELRNVNTGQFEVHDIAGNTLVGAASLGTVGDNRKHLICRLL